MEHDKFFRPKEPFINVRDNVSYRKSSKHSWFKFGAGDICFIIRLSIHEVRSKDLSIFCLFVGHFLNYNNLNVPELERLIRINVIDEGSFFFLSSTLLSSFGTLLRKGNISIHHEQRINHRPMFGTLWYGRRFVHYPVLFYDDNFEIGCSPWKKNSFGIVYMKYLSLYPHTNCLSS